MKRKDRENDLMLGDGLLLHLFFDDLHRGLADGFNVAGSHLSYKEQHDQCRNERGSKKSLHVDNMEEV